MLKWLGSEMKRRLFLYHIIEKGARVNQFAGFWPERN